MSSLSASRDRQISQPPNETKRNSVVSVRKRTIPTPNIVLKYTGDQCCLYAMRVRDQAAAVALPSTFIGLVFCQFELIKRRKKQTTNFCYFLGAYKFNVLSRVRGLRVTYGTVSWIIDTSYTPLRTTINYSGIVTLHTFSSPLHTH
jgi:hypothetical protein